MISCIASVMNRTDRVLPMLRSWSKLTEIGEFIIVDWSSTVPIINNPEIKAELENNKRLKIIRVEGQKYFYRGLAWNLAYQHTNPINKILLKLDIDYLNINSKWMKSLIIKDAQLFDYFITGCSKFYESSLGFLLINKKDFNKGYNENALPIWGYEDNDLIERLQKNEDYKSLDRHSSGSWSGLQRIIFFNISEYIFHMPHNFYADADNLLCLRAQGISKWGMASKNKEIFKNQPDWEPVKYKTIENSRNYIRLECLDNEKLENQIKLYTS
jgi:hypothetical protein